MTLTQTTIKGTRMIMITRLHMKQLVK